VNCKGRKEWHVRRKEGNIGSKEKGKEERKHMKKEGVKYRKKGRKEWHA
jgi:hypothetical protein